MKNWLQPILIGFILLVIALGLFQQKLGWGMLNVTNYTWLQTTQDSYTEYLSWEFYRQTTLHFPVLGTLEKYDYPSSSGVGVTGTVPILAMPLRLISGWLPDRFQYFGWWMCLNYILLAYFGALLLRAIGVTNSIWLILGGVWFLISPAFITRSGHLALCAHWLLLWAIWIYYVSGSSIQKYKMTLWNVGVAALIQPYLLAMSLGIHLATLWKEVINKQIPLKKAILFFLSYIPLVGICWFVAGNFNISLSSNSAGGYEVYSANLNVLWNSGGFAQIFPGFPWATSGQYEGYSYLGAGTIILTVLMSFYYLLSRLTKISFQPIWMVIGLMTVYALSNVVTFNEHIVIKYFGFPRFITDVFRGSGRFIWGLHYFLIFVGIKLIHDSRLPIVIKHLLFLSAFALQVYDLKDFFYADHYKIVSYTPKIDEKVWVDATKGAERLVMYPPYQWGYGVEFDFFDFANVAVENKLDITTGYLARSDKKARNEYREVLDSLLDEGTHLGDEQNAVFVSNEQYAYRLDKLYKNNLVKAFRFNAYILAVPISLKNNIEYLESHPEQFRPISIEREGIADFLQKHKNRIIFFTIRDEGTHKLCEEAKTYLRNAGARVDSLVFKDAYIGIFTKGKVVFDEYSKNFQIEKSWEAGTVLESAFTFPKSVTLRSWRSTDNQTDGSIKIDDQQFAPNLRGFNFVVVDSTFQVIEVAAFDTFQDCYRLKSNLK